MHRRSELTFHSNVVRRDRQPDSSGRAYAKAWVFVQKRQWVQAIAEAETAVADDPNNPEAEAEASLGIPPPR
jgi:hypothetical protein